MMRPRLAPIARLTPISRVRSATLMVIVFMTDNPPTTMLMSATLRMMALKMASVEPNRSSKSSPETARRWG